MAHNDDNDQRGLRRVVNSLPFIGTTGTSSTASSSSNKGVILSSGTGNYKYNNSASSSSSSTVIQHSSLHTGNNNTTLSSTVPLSPASITDTNQQQQQQPILINSTHSQYHGHNNIPGFLQSSSSSMNNNNRTVQSTLRNTLRGSSSFRKDNTVVGSNDDLHHTKIGGNDNKMDPDIKDWAEAYGTSTTTSYNNSTNYISSAASLSSSSGKLSFHIPSEIYPNTNNTTNNNTISTNVLGSAAVSDLHRGYSTSSTSTVSSTTTLTSAITPSNETPTPNKRSTNSTLPHSKDEFSGSDTGTSILTDTPLPLTKRKNSEPPSPPKENTSQNDSINSSTGNSLISSMASYLPGNLLPSVLSTLPAAVATLPTAILRKGQNALGLQNYMYPSSTVLSESVNSIDPSTIDTMIRNNKDYIDPDARDAIQYLQYIREHSSVRFEETMLRQAQLAADYHRMCDEQGIIITSLEKQLQNLHETHDKLRAQYNEQSQDIQQLLTLLAHWRTEYLDYNSDYLPSQIDAKYLPSTVGLSISTSSTTAPSLSRINSSSGNLIIDNHNNGSNNSQPSSTHVPPILLPHPTFVTINGHRYSLPVSSTPSSPLGSGTLTNTATPADTPHPSSTYHFDPHHSLSASASLSRRQNIAQMVQDVQQFLETYDTSSAVSRSSKSTLSIESKENTVSFDTVPIDWNTLASSLYQLLMNIEELASNETLHKTANVESRSLVNAMEYSGIQLRSIDMTNIEKKENGTDNEADHGSTNNLNTTTIADTGKDTMDTINRSNSLIVRNRFLKKELFDTFISAPHRCTCTCHSVLADSTRSMNNTSTSSVVNRRSTNIRSSPFDISVPILVENPNVSTSLSVAPTLHIDIPISSANKSLYPSLAPPGAIPRDNHPSPYAGKPVELPPNLEISPEMEERSKAVFLQAILTPSAESVSSYNHSNSIFGTMDGAFSDTSSMNTPVANSTNHSDTSGNGILYDSVPDRIHEYPITEADVQEALKEANQTIRDSPLHPFTSNSASAPSNTVEDNSAFFPDAVENEAAGLLSVLALEKLGAEATEARIRAETEADDADDVSDEMIDPIPSHDALPTPSISVPNGSYPVLPPRQPPSSLLSSASVPIARLYRVPTRGLRILSLDGGGIRGLLMIEFLKKIEADTGRRIWELFDLIAGTSTGGMCALALACHRSLEDIAKQYHMIRSTFEGQSAVWSEVKRIAVGASHSTEKAEAVLRSFFGDVRLSDTPVNPKVVVVSAAVDQYPAQPYLFRNYELTKEAKRRTHYLGTSGVSVFEAARATTSAPTFYEPAKVGNLRLVDGAIIANNPALVALAEAAALFPGANIDALVSLGTGTVSLRAVNTNNIVSWARIAMECVLSADPVHRTAGTLLGPDKYYRFDPESLGDIELSELRLDVIQKMLEEGRRYIHRNEPRFKELRYALGIHHHHHHHRTGNNNNNNSKVVTVPRPIVDLSKADIENVGKTDDTVKLI